MAAPAEPMFPTISGDVNGPAMNESGYTLNVPKLDAMPEGCFETNEGSGLRERESQTDNEVSRVYYVPWNVRHAFRLWALGFSTSSIVSAGAIYTSSFAYYYSSLNFPPSSRPPPNACAINRTIPAQDPERPWLFASSCELLAGKGAVANDPYNIVLDGNGNPVKDGDGDNLIAPCITFVDNNEGGQQGIVALSGNVIPLAWEVAPGGSFYRVVYRPRDYTILTDKYANSAANLKGELIRWTRITEEYNVEGIPLVRLGSSGTQLQFTPAAVTAGAPKNIIPEMGVWQLPSAIVNVDWMDVPDRPLATYFYCLGKINADSFGGVRGTPLYPPGTLFCYPWRTRQTVSPTGLVNWEIRFRFGYKPNGWNFFPYATPGGGIGFGQVGFGGDPAQPVYQSAFFNDLFNNIAPPFVQFSPFLIAP